MRARRGIALVLATLVATSLLQATTPPEESEAAVASQFDPGMIISDALFFDGGAMTSSAVQEFLSAKVRTCSSGYTCLKDYRQDTYTRTDTAGNCGTYVGAANETAATIITKVGVACGISQKAMLVLLQKEQGLVTSTAPSATRYRAATGYGCPDTAACDSAYYGFFNQVYMAALQFKRYAVNASRWNHAPGRVNAVRYHPNAACGSSSVYIQNQATAGLYNYTPYQPNGAALANLYGTGDSCSSYGNRNFWAYYTDWFGSTVTTTVMRSTTNATVYVVANGAKYPVGSSSLLDALAPLGAVSYVSDSYLATLTTGHAMSRIVLSSSGTVYYIDSGIKLPFSSCALVVDYGGSCGAGGYVTLTDAQVAAYVTGPPMTSVIGSAGGPTYHVTAGTKREILDNASRTAAGITGVTNVLGASAVDQLALAAPVVRDGFASTRGGTAVVAIVDGKRVTVPAADVAASGLTARGLSGLRAESIALIPASSTTFAGVVADGAGKRYLLSSTGRFDVTARTGVGRATAPVVPADILALWPDLGVLAAGALVKAPSNGTVYVVMPADIRPIASWTAMLALSETDTPVIHTIADAVAADSVKGPVALTTGALYRSADDATVFLINGVTTRVAFSKFDYPFAAGFTSFEYTTKDRLLAYPLEGTLLTFGLTCAGTDYVAAGGKAYSVAAGARANYPFTFVPLDTFTCRQLVTAGAASEFIRTDNGSIYLLSAGVKRPITSMARYTVLSGGKAWMSVPDQFAALIPTGPVA